MQLMNQRRKSDKDMMCPNCLATNQDGNEYCINCGEKLCKQI